MQVRNPIHLGYLIGSYNRKYWVFGELKEFEISERCKANYRESIISDVKLIKLFAGKENSV